MTAFEPLLASRLHLLDGVPPLAGGARPTPQEMARFMAFHAPAEGYTAPAAVVTDTVAPGPHGPVPVRVYQPADGSVGVGGLVWVHGLPSSSAGSTSPSRTS